MSVAGPTRARLPLACSGAMYPGVPTQETALRHRLAALDRLGQAEVGDFWVKAFVGKDEG